MPKKLIVFLYILNVSIIDTILDQKVAKIKDGKEPNGISIWSETSGGTP